MLDLSEKMFSDIWTSYFFISEFFNIRSKMYYGMDIQNTFQISEIVLDRFSTTLQLNGHFNCEYIRNKTWCKRKERRTAL